MFDTIYNWWRMKKREKVAKDPVLTGTTVETEEVIIPVGGITDDGTIYEKEVRPMGNKPIYTEVRMDGDQEKEKGKNAKKENGKT